MQTFVSYPKIGQFNNIIKNVIHAERYVGQDDNDEAVYNHNPAPVLKFSGSVKLHGSNSGIIYNSIDGMWVQSRKNIITPEKDNAGCAFQAYANKEAWQKLIDKVIERENVDPSKNNICIFSEWCGGNIQKGVAISGLPKMNVIFGIKIAPFDQLTPNYWVNDSDLSDPDNLIYNINDFPTFEVEIDFANPKMVQNKLIEITTKVADECPVGKFFGNSGIGEGVVWKAIFKNQQYLFKVKDERHSSSNIKVIAPIDTEKLESINAFVEYACTENRLNQMIEQTFTIENIEPNIKDMGKFLKNTMTDIILEEKDAMVESGLEPKMVGKGVSTKAKNWFMKYLDEQVGI